MIARIVTRFATAIAAPTADGPRARPARSSRAPPSVKTAPSTAAALRRDVVASSVALSVPVFAIVASSSSSSRLRPPRDLRRVRAPRRARCLAASTWPPGRARGSPRSSRARKPTNCDPVRVELPVEPGPEVVADRRSTRASSKPTAPYFPIASGPSSQRQLRGAGTATAPAGRSRLDRVDATLFPWLRFPRSRS